MQEVLEIKPGLIFSKLSFLHFLHGCANAVTIARIYSAADRRRQACTEALTRWEISGQSVPHCFITICICGSEAAGASASERTWP